MSAPTTRASYGRRRDTERDGDRAYRPDIEGLRAVAVGLVLLAHAGIPGLAGGFVGVDVFFVISGFLITGLLAREVSATGRVSLLRFWARRAKRLLPASATVLAVTVLLTWAFLPTLRWDEAGGDVVAAAAYVVNWHLASRSVDYLAEDSAPSVVQHYWSLSVEEQFYVLWPLLILAAVWAARRLRVPVRRALAVALTLIVVPSLAWSMWLTSTSAAQAYFVTPTRLWELGVGGLVALSVGWWRSLTPMAGRALAWSGLAVVIGGAAVIDTSTAWPGYAALVPTLGAAAVIAGGCGGSGGLGGRGGLGGFGAGVVLALPPMQRVGAMSYSLYLWHWPVLLVAADQWGPLRWWQGLLAVAASVVPAWLTYTLLEDPVRRWSLLSRVPRAALAVGAACTAVSLAAGLGLQSLAAAQVRDVPPGAAQGAAALGVPTPVRSTPTGSVGPPSPTATLRTTATPGPATRTAPTPGAAAPNPAAAGPNVAALDLDPESISPDPLRVTLDVPAIYARGCQVTLLGTAVRRCDLGSPTGRLTVALVGDSKAAQWADALDPVARQRGWRLQTYLKASCPWADAAIASGTPGAQQACRAWSRSLLATLTGPSHPDVVIVSGVKNDAVPSAGRTGSDTLIAGYSAYWNALSARGVRVIILKDTPSPGLNVYGCVADHRDDVGRCSYARNDGSGTPALVQAAGQVPGTTVATMNDWICPVPACPPVIGNVLVYRQGSHVTRTYVRTLTAPLGARLAPLVEAVPGPRAASP
ncbi:acyltransferase family protein [Luteipulveratus sp. YIM 133132]|uniref:acyltransferase family protein n=1 Tax=Luteipulveratus flavus TaxID=3031728 RepID=UPI0023B07FF9|nr:acyltransferase family protein [Luteipulveratus sp. YIM 133132]MDE9366671.1 acyltransferase family protein [Luteipulveratus sp. YIM 133132]